MFSSKFLSGANPLNAVSSAVNKFSLFGDDGEGEKKPSPQQAGKPPGEQQQGAGPGKDPKQQQGPQKLGQAPPMQKNQPAPKQGSPQLQGNGQTGPSNKNAGQQAPPKAGTQPEAQLKGEPPKNQPKGLVQQGSPKPGAQQPSVTKSGPQQGSPKAPSHQVSPNTRLQQSPANTSAQQKEPTKTGAQGSTKVGPELSKQQQGSPKVGQQQQQQKGTGPPPKQQASDQRGPVQQGIKGPGTSGASPAVSSSPGTTKARAQSKSLCPVCKTTELNLHTKEPPNHKTCTQCKTEVCSLCGFSPPDSDGREWLCLTCQIQRAQGTSEAPRPPMSKPSPNKTPAPQNQTPSPAAPIKKEIHAPSSSQNMQTTSGKVPAKENVAKGQETKKQDSPAPVQKTTPETRRTSVSPKQNQAGEVGRKQSSATPAPQQESGGFFGFGGAKTEAAKPEESVTGKMFGFGSSIFSSASTLISSAVQDEPKTTPPVSPKIQSTKENKPSPKLSKPEQEKKQEQSQQTKVQPASPAKMGKSPPTGKSSCPICKMVLNTGSKDPPNYNTCTDCKSIVCNQCGFNPMPNVKEGKEWLCLNCQVKRAAGSAELQSDTPLVNSLKKPMPTQPSPQKTSAPGSPQKKESTPATQPAKAEATDSQKKGTAPPGQTIPQGSQKTGPQKQPDQSGQKQDSGGFFGFGGSKTQSDASKPAESVTGKMFGFGSSFLSSASTLISSTGDELKITPPVSPKMSPAKDSKSPSIKKPEQDSKLEQPQQARGPQSEPPKANKPPPEPSKKGSASPAVSKSGPSACPLCKVELNVGSKDPPNYSKCTECKSTVCNQCGFNPMPNVKEVQEWLCLNCQMQRALGASEPPGTPLMKQQASPNKANVPASTVKKETSPPEKSPMKNNIPTPAESKTKQASPSGSPQRKPQASLPAQPAAKTEAMKGPESQKQVSPATAQKVSQQDQKTAPEKPPNQTIQQGPKKSSITSTQEESGGFFGFGSPKPQPDAAKPAESLGGKMFGFGSSLFSSASTAINSAVQGEAKTTPPVSPKMPAANKSPTVAKNEKENKMNQAQEPKPSPLSQARVEKGPPEPKKDAGTLPTIPKEGPSACPLCKTKLNFGSKEPPNYNKCTECKNTVCNQCGFNPMPNVSEVKEWLCLNCQVQRALTASELTAPPIKSQTEANKIPPAAAHQKTTTPNQEATLKKEVLKADDPSKTKSPVPDTAQKKGASTTGSPQKTQSTSVTPATKPAHGPESQAQASPTPAHKTPDTGGTAGPQKQTDQAIQPGQVKVASKTVETGKQPGPKTGPEASKTTESIGGKMFGFGSSIFSSASTLISSAVQDESRTTPPGSRKMSAPPQVSPKMTAPSKTSPKATPSASPKMSPAKQLKTQMPEEDKKKDESSQSKENKAQPDVPKTTTASKMAPHAGLTSCPLCKVELNIGSKLPPNYNTCTECKTTVCNQCGFNPMPIGEVKEWLCLTCQMKRAVGAPEPPGPPILKSQISPKKVPTPAAVQVTDSSKPATSQVKESPAVEKKPSEPALPQRKQSTASVKSDKSEASTAPQSQASPKPAQVTPQEKQKVAPEKLQNNANQPGRKLSNATAAAQQESGGFFGFGGSKTQPDAEKPTETVTGKMFGFGSSIFSSASTLITSAVQDQPKTTPPVSPKLSPAKDSKTPVKKAEQENKSEQPQEAKPPPPAKQTEMEKKAAASGKPEQEKKPESSQTPKTPSSGQAKADKPPSEPLNALQAAKRPDQSTCPLCKAKLNIGSKDQPNYNTCTECKNTVCNQCGFNPMPNETKVKEWLCLTCQMQRALGETQPKGVTSVASQPPAKSQVRDPSPADAGKKQPSAPQSPQRKLSATPQPVTSEAVDKPVVQKQASPVPSKKMPQEPQKSAPPDKSPVQTKPAERKQSNAAAVTQKDSGGFFGFGSGKTQPETEKPAESVTGKMFGFGSSIFSSASTLITSTVQDQPKTTPPVSPKITPAKEVKSPAAQVKSKPEQPQEAKTPPVAQTNKEKDPSKPPEAVETSHAPVQPGQSTCPLCKIEINMGSKDPPNYNTCTECKNIVCNQCGFTPMPNESKMKEWLCLTCQMQRALKATESMQPPLMKPQASPNKVSTAASPEKDAAANQKKDTQKVEASHKNVDSPTPEAMQKKLDVKEDTTPAPKLVKDDQVAKSAPQKEDRVLPSAPKQVAASTATPSKEMGTADVKTSQSAPAAPDTTKPESSAKLVSEVKQQKDEKVEKQDDLVRKSSDEGQPQQAPQKISEPGESSAPKNASPAAEKTNQESEGFFGFGSPKSQRAATKATEAVTGKVLGFGSSLFSSASTLITSAVQEQSIPSTRKMSAPQVSGRTSELQISPKSSPPVSPKKPVPSTRKMSAPQVSGKTSELKISPKSSPPVSPKKEKERDLKPEADQTPQVEKITAQPEQVKAPASEETTGDKRPLQPEKAEAAQAATKVGESTCPLCKVELNMDSKSLPNYNTCTECNAIVCSKCGFSPMPNLTEEKEWLCLNCQMQRALGASEPPGLPMMKLQPSPSKEVPVTTQKIETSVSTPQQDTSKQDTAKNELEAVATTKGQDSSALSTQTKKVAPNDAPDKTVSSTITKADVLPASSKPSADMAKGQPSVPQQQAPPVQTSSKPATLPDTQKEKPPPQQPPKAGDVSQPSKPAPSPSQPVKQTEKPSPQQPPKAGTTPAKSVTPPVQPAKQESGGFFGFGTPKTPSSAAKPAESVTGKMFGFGSSFLSSASTLITSAVQDEPKTTPPTPRKMSAAGSVSPKATPPVSPKITPAKDTKPPATQKSEAPPQSKPAPPAQAKAEQAPSKPPQQPPSPKTQPSKDTKLSDVQKNEENKAEVTQQEKTPSTTQVDKAPELKKKPAEAQAALKADQSTCPLCKIQLNMGSAEPPNYNTCTECKTTVCNQCGFNPMPNVSEVKEWLCLNCQMQRALGAAKEPAGPAAVKRQPSPSKVSTPPSSVQEKPKESTDVQKEAIKATPPKEQPVEAKGPMPTAVQKVEPPKTQMVSAAGQGKPQDVAGPQQPTGKPAQVQDSQTTKTDAKPQAPQATRPVSQPSKPAPQPSQPVKQTEKPSPQQPPKAGTTPAKSVTPPVQPAKQESGGFFGFGTPKTPPTAAKSAESVKGKMFGFGSSFLSSASTLITSAVQDEPKTTPPTPRKMSTSGSVSPKATPPVSPKMAPAKDTKPPVAQKTEPPQAKPSSPPQGKVEKEPVQPPKSTEVIQSASKAGLSTCPLCKVELNMGSKDPPNYNTCTECKNTVCNLCGFNPMPHTAVKEWLCLNCQTQRALSGHLGDAEKMPQPVSTKPEKTEPKSAPVKPESTAGATKSQPVAATVQAVPTVPTSKAKVESASVKMEAVATAVPVQTEPIPTTAKVVPTTAGKASAASTTEPLPSLTAQIVQPETLPKAESPITPVEPVKKAEVKKVADVKEFPTAPDSKPDIKQAEAVASAASSLPVAQAEVVPTSSTAVELEKAATEAKQEQSVPEKIIKDDIVTQPTQALQQNHIEPKSEEQQPVKEVESAVAIDSKEVAAKTVRDITTITSTPDSQPLSTKHVTIQDQDESREDFETKSKVLPPTGQVQLEEVAPLTQLPLKLEESVEDQPQILPILQEVNDEKPSDAPKDNLSVVPSMPLKTGVKADRRRLSFQAMDESSESEITPSPSPKVQRRRLQVTNISSSSEDLKTESADSSVEDEDFIRKQIMGMGDEEEMSVSDDEKEKKLAIVESVKEDELDNVPVTAESLLKKGSTDNEDNPARNAALSKTDAALAQNITETMPKTTFKKAIPALRQRQSTDDDVESITESLSKGSSSVQASSFTPESSHTSASSLEEDSDSSPSHRKVSRDKRKGKHRQPTQPLPTIEDSSDEEKMRTRSHPLSPTDGASSPDGLRQVTVIDETHRTSGSDYSASIESEPEAKRAVQRGRKPSPTVIPYTSSEPSEMDTLTKSLKRAEEAYEEIIQKTKAIPGESPPDVEPLYGGMAIEDYLYESLVEEPEIKVSDTQLDQPRRDSGSESVKKLRSPEEVYEEMMQKKRELMMIEHEFQQAQTAMDSSSSAASVTGSPSVSETCVVTISTEETGLTGQTDIPTTTTETSGDVTVKKKKRPAPPRPSEPPKRTEGMGIPCTPTGSIGFVRPMIPQDPALRKALFPIPDLKITQCSSGEEEDDSLADEYGMGMSSDITPSDDSETKEDPSISPPLSETTEMEPICVVCEIPEPKPIPTPISAPELTTTPSPVSPVSPPTSPATPDSSLASNATSSSSFQAQTSPSSDSTPMSTPTPPTSYKGQTIPETSSPVISSAAPASQAVPAAVIVTIPDVVSDPSKAEKPSSVSVKVSAVDAKTQLQKEPSTTVPVLVQMPDLVSSPSQVPSIPSAVLQVSSPSPIPSVVSAQPVALVQTPPVSVTTSTSASVISTSVALPICPGPVIVQMPDLVSTAAPISAQTPVQVSALVTTATETQAKVVSSVPIQSSVQSMRPFQAPLQTTQVFPPAPSSTTIVKKKVPPPPPPRSTSVSLPESTPELPPEKMSEHIIPIKERVAGQTMQSVVVDIQPRMEDMQPDSTSVPQVVTQTRQGHVVIIVPSVEKLSQSGQTTQERVMKSTSSPQQGSETTTRPTADIPGADVLSAVTAVSSVQVASAPAMPPKPTAGAKASYTVEIPVKDSTPLPSSTSPKPTVCQKSSISSAVTTSTEIITQITVTTTAPSQMTKPPPPIPPKPILIPAGLVFSHKPGESVKPPPPPVAAKAATLPRTKEPPNALSLSLTRPVESKLGTTSPKSPLSPRHAKCLQTYVVITLPSEPGSPTEAITVQAPLRRGSIPSTKVSGVRTTPSEQKTPTESFSAQATVRRASVPTVRHPPPTATAPTGAVEQVITSQFVVTEGQARKETVQSILPVADITTLSSNQTTSIQLHTVPPPIKKPYVELQQSITESIPPPKLQTITVPTEPEVVIQPQSIESQARAEHVSPVLPEGPTETRIPETLMQIPSVEPGALTEVVTVPLQSEESLNVQLQNIQPEVHSTVTFSQVGIIQKDHEKPTRDIVREAVQLRSPVPEVTSNVIDVQQPINVFETATEYKEQEASADYNNTQAISELSSLTQFVPSSEILPSAREHLSLHQPVLLSEVVTIPSNDLATDIIAIDTDILPEVASVSQDRPASAVVAPISEMAKMMTPSIAEASLDVHQMAAYPDVTPIPYIQEVQRAIPSSAMSYSVPPLEATTLQAGYETPMQIATKDIDEGSSMSASEIQQSLAGMQVVTTEATTSRRRTSISSTVQPPYTSEMSAYSAQYEIPTQVVTTEQFATTRRESITMPQSLPSVQVVNMPAERDVPIDVCAVQAPYRRGSIASTEQQPQVLTYSSEYDRPLEIITTEAYTRRTSVPSVQDVPQGVSVAPVTITKIQQESIESQEIRGPEKVVSSMSHMYSSSISTSGQPPESLPSRVTQVVTTEVQRTTVSVVHERLPQVPPSVGVTIQPEIAKAQPVSKQNGIYPGDVIDLRTMKVGVKMTEQGMDLTPPESCRHSFSSDSSGRQITAVQPEIVNLSAEITPATTLSVVTDSITIVTCTATIASYQNTPAEKPLDLQGPVMSSPLPLTTYKPFEPLAQIVYRPVNTQPKVSAVASTAQDIPINLSFEALVSAERKHPVSSSPIIMGNGGSAASLEATGAMDLSNYRPVRAMVALSGSSPGVVTTVVEDDGTPVDLTAGRRSVCCDVIYKLPFTGSCRTQPPVTTQPDGHNQYGDAGIYGTSGIQGLRASLSDTNVTAAGLFSPKNDYDYLSGSPDAAIDLTAARLSAGKALDYTSKAAGLYPVMTSTPYSQVSAAGFGVNSALRTSDGIVYSSVSAPVPSTYAITTQPGSIFSTTITPTSTVQNQSLPHPYGFIPTTDPGQIIPYDTGLPKELLPSALADIITGYPEMYSDTTLEAIAASLDALASSPIFPGLDNAKMAQYQMEREFLELEKLKQLCLAEELEWERQEIQRYREQEQIMVQRELEELQALKQQLLLQQEEEHHAHMVAQQETYAQQKEQLQQIQQLQLQLQRQLDEHYTSSGTTGNLLDAKYAGVGDSGQYWPVKDESTTPTCGTHAEEGQDHLNLVNKLQADQDFGKKIIDSGVQTDDEDSAEKQNVGRRKKSRRNTDSSAQTDDEDQDEWDAPTKARRRSRKHSSEGKHGSKVSSIAIQTVAEISVQTDHSGTIKRPNLQMDTKVEIIKHISAPENSQRGGSLSCQTDSDRRHAPIEVGYSTHLTAEVPSKSKVFYTAVSPLSPEKSHGGQRMLTADPTRFSSGPRILKPGQKSLSDPKSLSPSTEDRMGGYYADSYSSRGSPSSTGKKVKRTLPDPPPEDDSLTGRAGYSTGSARRRLARSTTMARAKILQDIDKELDLVERESSKLRKKQAELDEEEKEIDAKLRYLEMGINRRKEALLKEREKRERAYLQGVAEERDYMSDSEVGNIREARGDGLERPRTAPQSEFDQFIPPQTEADSQYNTLTSPYSHYAQYVPQTQTTSHYTQQNLYQQQSLYHQQVSPYPTLSLTHGQNQPSSYQHALLLQQGKQRQTNLSDLEPKITTNYEVIRNQPLLIVPTSSESGYGVAHLGGKYGSLDLRLGLEERSMASSPMSSISADSFYADIDHHNARNYVLIEDIGELTKASTGLGNTGLSSGFNLPDKELSKADRLLRAAEVRRTAEVAEFLGSSRLQGYGKGEDDTMEEPYELKLLKQQIKQEFRRGTEGLEQLTGLGLPQYIHSDSSLRHFPKGEKYSIGRLTLEKQAAKQLPAAMLYQKQMKNKKALIDPKAITKFSPIQESRDLEPEFGSYMGSGASSVSSLAARARLLQDEITFGLRKNLSEQQKYLGSSLGANLSGSLNLGQSLGLGSTIRASAQDDGTYPSGSRSRPSSRPSSVYGLDLSIKRDLSSSSLRLKTEGDVLDAAFAPGVARAKPTSLPISQSRGRIPIVAQNSEEESPLSPVGQPMGMARASAGPLPPISADSRDQFGSSHSLPEVQQHMREESRTRGYDRDIAFIMDDLQGAMSDSEAGGPNWNIEAYHLRREDTDWFDKPREGHPQGGNVLDRRQMKLVPYAFPHTRIKLKRDIKDSSVSGNGLGIRVVGGKEIPGSRGEIGAYIAKVIPGGVAEQTGKVVEGMQVLEWNGVPLMGKTYEEVQCIMGQPCAEAEICVRLDLNMLSDPEHPQALEHHIQLKAGGQRSPGVDPKQLAAELQKVSQQQGPGMAGAGVGPGGLGMLSALERSALLHSGPGSAASSGVPSPGQPASPAINKKQRHKPEIMRTPHLISGEIQLQINYDRNLGNLIVHVLQARNLAPRDNDGYSDPFVKVYLLPGRGQVMVVQNASADNKRRTKYAQRTLNPEWNQTVIYKNIHLEQLKKKTLEVTVWDYDRSSSNDFLGEVLIDLSNTAQLDNTPRWLPLKEQSESIEHSRAHHGTQGPPGSGQGHGQTHSLGQGHMSVPGQGYGQGQAPGLGDGSHDSPKNSVIKSRSHGIFPDPAKDMQMLPLEKSHSSPGSSKSSSDGQLRSHGPSRSQSKSSVTQAHLEDAGIAIAAAEAAVQQSRLQPRPGHRLGDVSGSVVLSAPSLVGDAYGDLEGDEGAGTGVDSAIFQVPRIGKAIPNGTDKNQLGGGGSDNEGGKTQVMGEIKVALKKEVKTEGDQLVLEILQCRNITYKFKSPDHLPDLYVKLYVVNVATQKRIIKKKTRVCRHDREPSFNETFRFPLNPTGHSIQLFLVSNGGKFVKKTLIGEAYIWLDKVDMRKRVVSWHKLFVSSTQTNP